MIQQVYAPLIQASEAITSLALALGVPPSLIHENEDPAESACDENGGLVPFWVRCSPCGGEWFLVNCGDQCTDLFAAVATT